MYALGVPGWIVAIACAALALAGLVRLALVDAAGRDVELARVLMALAMGTMALAWPLPWWLWPVLLALAAAASGYRLARGPRPDVHRPHRAHHLVAGIALAYLLVAPRFLVADPTAATPQNMLLLAGYLAVIGYFAGAAALATLGLLRLSPAPLPPVAPAPRLTAACQLLMSLLMVDMVVAMV
jgi:uncharacterized protein DUF5134